jgi:hypothetical protein
MSTLCRAAQRWQEYGGTETSERPFFCQIHFSAFLKRVNGCRRISDNRKYFGNISEKQPFSEIISDYFLGKDCHVRLAVPKPLRRRRVKPGQTKSNRCKWSNHRENICNYLKMKGLHNQWFFGPMYQSETSEEPFEHS